MRYGLKPRKILFILFVLTAVVIIRTQTDWLRENNSGDFGLWSLVPPLLTISLCFLTREVILSLFFGILAGGLISGKINVVQEFLIPSIGSQKYGEILLVYLWCLGGLIGLWTKTGGALFFAQRIGTRFVRDPRSAKLFAFLLGVVFHQGGTISTVLAGSTSRPVCDAKKVSHEELTYIIDSTASPIATLLPFNVWPIYIGSLIVGTTPLFADLQVSQSYLFKAIPYNFYSWIAVLLTFFFSWEKLPWCGRRMRQAIIRAREENKLNRDGAAPLVSNELCVMKVPQSYRVGWADFLVPIGVLLGVAILPYLLFGKLRVSEAFMLAVLSAMIVAACKGMALKDIMEGFIDGCKGVTIGAVILGLAVTMGSVSGALGTAQFIIRTTSHMIAPFLLPAILLFITMLISFSIGTSWGTYAVVFPIAMPLAWSVHPDPFFITLCFAAVTGGSVYGDNCSPISDTTILSSLACCGDLMDHVLTQLPLATAAALVSALLYTAVALLAI